MPQPNKLVLGGEAAVWLMDPRRVDPAAWPGLLTDEERRRAADFGGETLRHDALCTRVLQRLTLSAYVDVDPAAWRFAASEGRRPEIASPAGYEALRFNLSHTAGLIVCAVAWDAAIGVDVEALHSARDVDAVARRFFAPAEAATLAGLAGAEKAWRFLELWTLKEACLKALGTGLAASTADLCFDVAMDGTVTTELDPRVVPDAQAWQFVSRRLGPDHVLGLAIPKGSRPDRLVLWHRFEA